MLKGFAGTGKTFLVAELVRHWENRRQRVKVTAPTHKAVEVLRAKMDKNKKSETLKTLHSFLSVQPVIDDQKGKEEFRRVMDPGKEEEQKQTDILVIDEASMINRELMDIVDECTQGKDVLFVGDPFQIPPVGEKDGRVFLDRNLRVFELDSPIRQSGDSPVLELATSLREPRNRNAAKPLDGLVPGWDEDRIDDLDLILVPPADRKKAGRWMLDAIEQTFFEDPDDLRFLAWTNQAVHRANLAIRNRLFDSPKEAYVPGDLLVTKRPCLRGKEILLNNNVECRVMDKQLVELSTAHGSFLTWNVRVRVSDERKPVTLRLLHGRDLKLFDVALQGMAEEAKNLGGYRRGQAWRQFFEFRDVFDHVDYGYALTCHKSQGSTYRRVVIDNRDIEKNNKIYERNRIRYTGVTRASEKAIILL